MVRLTGSVQGFIFKSMLSVRAWSIFSRSRRPWNSMRSELARGSFPGNGRRLAFALTTWQPKTLECNRVNG